MAPGGYYPKEKEEGTAPYYGINTVCCSSSFLPSKPAGQLRLEEENDLLKKRVKELQAEVFRLRNIRKR